MANLTMVFIFDEILAALSKLGLTEGSIQQYTRYFRKMQRFFLEKGASEYSERLLDEYWMSVTQNEIPYSQTYLSSLRKSIYIIKKYAAGDGVSCSFMPCGSRYNPSTAQSPYIKTEQILHSISYWKNGSTTQYQAEADPSCKHHHHPKPSC